MLSPQTQLQLAPNLQVLIHASDHIEVLVGSNRVNVPGPVFAILEAFSLPATLGEALQRLQGRVKGAQDWINLTQTITHLHHEGVLLDLAAKKGRLDPTSTRFDSLSLQATMLNDRHRTQTFLQGIAEVVRPGDVVVDVGTGNGILALAAARAGASRVYAIEATDIGQTARAIFEANGFGDVITLVPGLSTQIELPERADVMVSEIIGNQPLGEQVLETTLDACKRLLKPDARLLPRCLRLYGLPVAIPDAILHQRTVPADTAARWREWYGFEFSPLFQSASDQAQTFLIKPQHTAAWPALSEPILLAEVDLASVQHVSIDQTLPAVALAEGKLNGLLVYFELDLGPTTTLSTHPAQAAPENHWYSSVWALPEPVSLKPGDSFDVTYRYRVAGAHDGLRIARRP